MPDGKPVTARLVFTSRDHAACSRNYFNSFIWKPALKATGVPQTREDGFHALRRQLRQRSGAHAPYLYPDAAKPNSCGCRTHPTSGRWNALCPAETPR
jgi:hypothetical protein